MFLKKCVHVFYAFNIIQLANSSYIQPYETQGQWRHMQTIDSDGDFRYLVSSQKVNFFQAMVLCKQNHDMELASITSMEEEELIENQIKMSGIKYDPAETFWIGGTRHGACGSDFVWLAQGKPVLFTKYAPKQPDNAGNSENCLEIALQGQDNFAWSDSRCDKKSGFICQTSNRSKNDKLTLPRF